MLAVGPQAHNIAEFLPGMSQEDTPTWGVDTPLYQRVPQKILKKSNSLYYTAALGLDKEAEEKEDDKKKGPAWKKPQQKKKAKKSGKPGKQKKKAATTKLEAGTEAAAELKEVCTVLINCCRN